MKYKILPNLMKGILLTRQPDIYNNVLELTFTNAPRGATAMFERKSDNVAIYRLLTEYNSCSLPVSFLVGEIGVSVAVLNGRTATPVYVCEGLKATVREEGTLICPNDNNLPVTVNNIQEEMQRMIEQISVLTNNYSELNNRFDRLLEGYDVT